MVLQVEKSRSPLNIGKSFRPSHLLPLKYLPGTERPFELAYEFLQVVLHHPIQRHQVAIDIVEDFNWCSLGPHEVERRAASENLNIAFMRRE